VSQQIEWASKIKPIDVPIRTARGETGLASVPGVALLETRRREGADSWVPVDHGTLYLTDRRGVFSGTKNVEFRYDKIQERQLTPSGLFLRVSSRRRPHILSGPAERVDAMITASLAVGSGMAPTSPFVQAAAELRRRAEETESGLDTNRAALSALVAPPRPISPAWLPLAGLVLIMLTTNAATLRGTQVEAIDTTTTSSSTTTVLTTTTTTRPTTTTPVTTTSLPELPGADVLFGPPLASESGDPRAPLSPEAGVVTILSITDGDTLEVGLFGGGRDIIRLIGINSPERGECWVDEAALVLAKLAPVGSEVGLTNDVSDRDDFNRLLRYMWVGGMSVNQELVRRGAAISRRYPPDTSLAADLEAAQSDARASQLGLWNPEACGPVADAELRITTVHYDASGDDNQNLNEEWITIRNEGDNLVDLSGWTIRDESASNRFQFPDSYVLSPRETVTIRSGCGDDFGTDLFWCSVGSAVWNNDGDTAFLTDPSGNIHHDRSYSTPTTTTSSTTTTTVSRGGGSGGDSGCHPSYTGECVPIGVSDVDCLGGSGDGPYYVGRVNVVGPDEYGLDRDDDGIGCE
jgi:micrococcal nuclease